MALCCVTCLLACVCVTVVMQVLYDAFFKHQRKPRMTCLGELYYEGSRTEAKLEHLRPGVLSEDLREALGMSDSSPPPWLINMQVTHTRGFGSLNNSSMLLCVFIMHTPVCTPHHRMMAAGELPSPNRRLWCVVIGSPGSRTASFLILFPGCAGAGGGGTCQRELLLQHHPAEATSSWHLCRGLQ